MQGQTAITERPSFEYYMKRPFFNINMNIDEHLTLTDSQRNTAKYLSLFFWVFSFKCKSNYLSFIFYFLSPRIVRRALLYRFYHRSPKCHSLNRLPSLKSGSKIWIRIYLTSDKTVWLLRILYDDFSLVKKSYAKSKRHNKLPLRWSLGR